MIMNLQVLSILIFAYQIIKIILSTLSKSAFNLYFKLNDSNTYILSNNFSNSGEKELFLNLTYYKECELSKIDRIIDVSNNNSLFEFLNLISKSKNKLINLILDSSYEEDNQIIDFIALLLHKNNYTVNIYIPNYCPSSLSIFLLISKNIYLNWHSCISPIIYEKEFTQDKIKLNDFLKNTLSENLIKNNEVFNYQNIETQNKDYYIKNIVTKKKFKNIGKSFLLEKKSIIKHDHNSLKTNGINTKTVIPDFLENIYFLFNSLK